MRSVQVGSVLLVMAWGVLVWGAGCGGSSGNNDNDAGGSSGGSSGGDLLGGGSGDGGSRCVNGTECPSTSCPNTSPTTITGTIYDPAGNNPLPFISVYVPQSTPNGHLDPLPKGASCECNALFTNTVLASDITNAQGQFTIKNAPVGQSIPLVVQAGKWRKLYSLTVNACQPNSYNGVLRLPANSSEGDLPDIAISTGGADSLECLLTRVGVSDSEFVDGASTNGHVHIFQGGTTNLAGGGAGPTIDNSTPLSYKALWDKEADLKQFDVVLLSCEGGETGSTNPTALDQYVKMDGGRVFASHFHYSWFTDTNGPFVSYNLGEWKPGTNSTGNINAIVQTKTLSGAPFAKGQGLHDWLSLVGALGKNVQDELPILVSRYNVLVNSGNPNSVPWIDADQNVDSNGVPGMTQYFSWDEPIGGGENVCGRVVYSDLHVGGASDDYGNLAPGTTSTPPTTTGGIVPRDCQHNVKLSPQEAALEFMLFDLSSCLTPPTMPPPPPMVAQ